MDISFVLAVYNMLNLTKACYSNLRVLYPDAPLVISSGGSTDGTKEWLESLEDDNLSFIHDDERLTFSNNYNSAIRLVDTEKLVLIHNDMVIGRGFLENLSRLLDDRTIITYTTVEPPIFTNDNKPGKVIIDMGRSFEDFDQKRFDNFVDQHITKCTWQQYGRFFMSGHKKTFDDIGGFDGFSFDPAFCEDDDFLIRAKLKGYELKTVSCAIVYHFVSKTSRFSDEFKEMSKTYEIQSNRNFVRKWGLTIATINRLRYWEDHTFKFKTFSIGLTPTFNDDIHFLEPFFNKINLKTIPEDYIESEQPHTRYDLRSKFTLPETVDVMIYDRGVFTKEDYNTLHTLRLSIPHYSPGRYEIGNMVVEIRKPL